MRREIAKLRLMDTNAPHAQLSSPGLTGRPNIPPPPVIKSRSRGVLDTPQAGYDGLWAMRSFALPTCLFENRIPHLNTAASSSPAALSPLPPTTSNHRRI